jgi:hypothetical protein
MAPTWIVGEVELGVHRLTGCTHTGTECNSNAQVIPFVARPKQDEFAEQSFTYASSTSWSSVASTAALWAMSIDAITLPGQRAVSVTLTSCAATLTLYNVFNCGR